MITMFIKTELVMKEYEKEAQSLINILRNSNSKYKDIPIEKMNWSYTFSYFRKKSENTPEYYEELFKLPFEERLETEIKKVRVNIALAAGYFYISDRVDKVSDSIKEAVKQITAQKMVNEQELIGDESVLKTIPFVKDEEMPKPMSLQEQLKHAIEIEDYMEAARIRDEIKKMAQEVM
jgi:hypothetical protein